MFQAVDSARSAAESARTATRRGGRAPCDGDGDAKAPKRPAGPATATKRVTNDFMPLGEIFGRARSDVARQYFRLKSGSFTIQRRAVPVAPLQPHPVRNPTPTPTMTYWDNVPDVRSGPGPGTSRIHPIPPSILGKNVSDIFNLSASGMQPESTNKA